MNSNYYVTVKSNNRKSKYGEYKRCSAQSRRRGGNRFQSYKWKWVCIS